MNLRGRDPKDAALFAAVVDLMGIRRRLLKGADRHDVAHDAIVNMRHFLTVLPADMVAELAESDEYAPWLPKGAFVTSD